MVLCYEVLEDGCVTVFMLFVLFLQREPCLRVSLSPSPWELLLSDSYNSHANLTVGGQRHIGPPLQATMLVLVESRMECVTEATTDDTSSLMKV